MERNPYYWAVDTAGNQLPHIDRIVMNLAENLEVLNLRAIAGEYDLQERHVSLNKLPVFIERLPHTSFLVCALSLPQPSDGPYASAPENADLPSRALPPCADAQSPDSPEAYGAGPMAL